jgi:uncharacterized coiled-coil DUF342 family protein
LGSKLQQFAAVSAEISSQTSDLSSMLNLSSDQSTLGILCSIPQDILRSNKQICNCIETISEDIKVLKNILKFILNQDKEFNTISRTLAIVGTNIKIHGASIKQTEGNTLFFASKIDLISKQTDKIIKDLFSDLAVTFEDISRLENKIDTFINNSRKKISDFEDTFENVLKSIGDISSYSDSISQEAAESSNEISEIVNNIITSMQSNDITRQQIEHIGEAFEDICSKVDRAGTSNDKEARILLSESFKIASIQRVQIELVSREIKKSGQDLFSGFSSISSTLSNMIDRISVAAGIKNPAKAGISQKIKRHEMNQPEIKNPIIINKCIKSKGSLVSCFSSEIKNILSMTKSFSEVFEVNKFILEQIHRVSSSLKTTSVSFKKISEISDSIKRLAVNAQIESARIGNSGNALSTLAQEVQRVSDMANNISVEVVNLLNRIDSHDINIKRVLNDQIAPQMNLVSDLQKKSANSNTDLNNLNKDFTATIENVIKTSEDLSDSIEKTVNGISFTYVIDSLFTGLTANANNFLKTLLPVISIEEVNQNEQALAELRKRYTMESERKAETIARTALNNFDASNDLGDSLFFDSDSQFSSQPPQGSEIDFFDDFMDEHNMMSKGNSNGNTDLNGQTDSAEDSVTDSAAESSESVELLESADSSDEDDFGDNVELF